MTVRTESSGKFLLPFQRFGGPRTSGLLGSLNGIELGPAEKRKSLCDWIFHVLALSLWLRFLTILLIAEL